MKAIHANVKIYGDGSNNVPTAVMDTLDPDYKDELELTIDTPHLPIERATVTGVMSGHGRINFGIEARRFLRFAEGDSLDVEWRKTGRNARDDDVESVGFHDYQNEEYKDGRCRDYESPNGATSRKVGIKQSGASSIIKP